MASNFGLAERGDTAPAFQSRQPSRDGAGIIERVATGLAGGGLAAIGTYQAARHSPIWAPLALAGGWLVYRGVSGRPSLLERSGLAGEPVAVEHVLTVNRSADDLYRHWHTFENLPRFMQHLVSVTVQGPTRSRWVAKAPAGSTVAWDAEITQDRPGELIAWRSLPGSQIENAGSVRFRPGPIGRGTEVTVRLEYRPPGGGVGRLVAFAFGQTPSQQVAADLRRFKSLMEAGEIPTTQGQPTCR